MQRAAEAYIRDMSTAAFLIASCGLCKAGPCHAKRSRPRTRYWTACCDDDNGDLVGWMKPGKSRKRGFVWRPGSMPPESMVIVAQNLMMHGIIGKAKVRKLQRYETNETHCRIPRSRLHHGGACNHFGISREEAENLHDDKSSP